MEVNVQLHGYTWHEGKEYYIASAEAIPSDALLLTSKIRPLYSGLKVTNQLPMLEAEAESTDTESDNGKLEQ